MTPTYSPAELAFVDDETLATIRADLAMDAASMTLAYNERMAYRADTPAPQTPPIARRFTWSA